LPICCTILRVPKRSVPAAAPAAPALRTLEAWQHLRAGGDSGLHVHRIRGHAEASAHDHLFHEVVYVETGTAEHVTADGTRRLRPGDVIVIRPQVWHAYARPRGLGIVNCLIDTHLMHRLAALLATVDGAFELFRRRLRDPRLSAPTVLHAGPAERSAVLARVETIMSEQRARTNGWQAAATAALLDVLVTLARLGRRGAHSRPETIASGAGRAGGATSGGPEPTALADRTEQAVLDVASHIESHFAESVSLDDLADRVHLSPGHLSRSFGRRMGMGIVEFVHRMRAEEACRLLRYTDEPIKRIAGRVGYDEIAYFSRCFRAQVGQSPRAYRQAWQQPTDM
jgi:AraC family transcriptional regulator, L-rhamnose operon transcriptional activator RhaR